MHVRNVFVARVNKTADGAGKRFYSAENLSALKRAGYKIAVVSPELHRVSPGLLGGEAHEDGADPRRLEGRWKEIIALGPDAICTDFPDRLSEVMGSSQDAARGNPPAI